MAEEAKESVEKLIFDFGVLENSLVEIT